MKNKGSSLKTDLYQNFCNLSHISGKQYRIILTIELLSKHQQRN